MADAVANRTRFLTPECLEARVVYTRSIPPPGDGKSKARNDQGKPIATLVGLRDMPIKETGAMLYSGNCASCHQWTGTGIGKNYYPALLRNSVTGADSANSLVLVILDGVQRDMGKEKIVMPGFGSHLSDQQVAALDNYVGQQFGGGTTNLRLMT